VVPATAGRTSLADGKSWTKNWRGSEKWADAEEMQRVGSITGRIYRGSNGLEVWREIRLAGGEPGVPGSRGRVQISLKRVQQATAEDLRAAAQKWLSDGVYILEVTHSLTTRPRRRARIAAKRRYRTPPELSCRSVQRATLSNGLKEFWRSDTSSLVNFTLATDAGFASDASTSAGLRPGHAGADDGTRTRNALQSATNWKPSEPRCAGLQTLICRSFPFRVDFETRSVRSIYLRTWFAPIVSGDRSEARAETVPLGIRARAEHACDAGIAILPGLLYDRSIRTGIR